MNSMHVSGRCLVCYSRILNVGVYQTEYRFGSKILSQIQVEFLAHQPVLLRLLLTGFALYLTTTVVIKSSTHSFALVTCLSVLILY